MVFTDSDLSVRQKQNLPMIGTSRSLSVDRVYGCPKGAAPVHDGSRCGPRAVPGSSDVIQVGEESLDGVGGWIPVRSDDHQLSICQGRVLANFGTCEPSGLCQCPAPLAVRDTPSARQRVTACQSADKGSVGPRCQTCVTGYQGST